MSHQILFYKVESATFSVLTKKIDENFYTYDQALKRLEEICERMNALTNCLTGDDAFGLYKQAHDKSMPMICLKPGDQWWFKITEMQYEMKERNQDER